MMYENIERGVEMRCFEELSMNALPSLQTILYDGWIIRFANGYTNRANSINPIYTSYEDVNHKIEQCECIFRNRKLKPTYKITPFVSPVNLDMILENRGYVKIHETSVQTMELSDLVEPSVKSVKLYYEFSEDWFKVYCRFNNISSDNINTYRKMLNNLIPFNFYASLILEDECIACGMAVKENEYIGLFDIIVKEGHRNLGYGEQLLLNILREGKLKGAESAYLQVMLDNLPALSLYAKLGFKEEYRYHYRVLKEIIS